MIIKRFTAPDMRQALKLVRTSLGSEAVILSSQRRAGNLEVVAAIDYDETLVHDFRAAGQDSADSKARPAESTQIRSEPMPAPIDALIAAEESGTVSATSPQSEVSGWSSARSQVPDPVGKPPTALLDLSAMQAEINALRLTLEGQLSSLAWNDLARRSPVHAAILRQLLHMGISPDLAQDLAEDLEPGQADFKRGWHQVLSDLVRRIETAHFDPLSKGGTVALVGATGVGKTTTLVKMASLYARHFGPEHVVMISCADYRVGAQEQLFTYGRMLNIPVYVATTSEQLKERMARLSHARLVLLDTAGASLRDERLGRTIEALRQAGRPLMSYIVLPANAERQFLEESVSSFAPLGLHGCIITKLDESGRLGGLLSVLVRHRLPIALSCDGQDITDHLRRASSRNLVRLAHEQIDPGQEALIDDVIAQQIMRGQQHVHA